ncbi:hypothetical protein GOP47_0005572 [Adiantum capillus-veneris]|uniref:Uncharacterized protein n=1 Tax=Adiantum capillus-veneris TaxID=13818 RepID=A0A9D4ZLI2_ADICA|nr:hypothetical protein GOP47_0005572 [Adiantum capillus-veneris]
MQQASSCLLRAASTFYRAQVLEDDYSVYEIGQQSPFQEKRQLDGFPVSAYGWDSSLSPASGRLIAVNCSYVCYCLRSSGGIRILGRNARTRGLFEGHKQRVTDIEFFAEDENLVASVSLDARVFVWRIIGNVRGKDDFHLQQHVILAIHFEGSWENVCPRVCWHPHSQEILVVCMSNHIFKIDIEKAQSRASQLNLSEKAFLSCSAANLLEGISCIGQHDAEVTDLSIIIEDALYIASACNDGMVRFWEDCKANPLAVLRPHDGQPVGSVFFLTCDSQPDKVALLTSDSTNKILRLYVPTAPSYRFSTWSLVQTLEFKSCDGIFVEKLVSNGICTLPQAGLVFLGNSESPSLYSVYLNFGGALNEVRMNRLTEFSLSMPILSFSAVIEARSSMTHIFCVQTQAIQEYCLNISECLIPQCHEPVLASSSGALLEAKFMKLSVCKAVEGEDESKISDMTQREMAEVTTANSNSGSGFGSWVEVPNWIAATVKRHPNSASPLASGVGAGSTNLLMEDQELSSISPGDVSASLSTLPSLRNSKMVADINLPVEPNALPSSLDPENWKHDVTAVTTSDSASKLFLSTSHDHQESESTIVEEPPMILQGSRTTSCSQIAGEENGMNTCSGVKLDHFEGGTAVASTAVIMEEIKDGLLSAVKDETNEPQEELNPPALENSNNKLKKNLTRRRRKGSGFRVTKEHKVELGLPELESPSNSLKRKKTRRRRDSGFRVAKRKHKEHQKELALPVLESPNKLKRKRTRRSRKRSAQANEGITSLVLPKSATQIQHACRSPSINGEDLSEQLIAIRESVDKLVTTQLEFQNNLSTMIDVTVSREIEVIGAFQEEWIHGHLISYWDVIWRRMVEKSNKNILQFEWLEQLRKAFVEFFSKDFQFTPTLMLTEKMISCIESNIIVPISASVDEGMITMLSQIIEVVQSLKELNRRRSIIGRWRISSISSMAWDKDFFRYVEKSLETKLDASLRDQMDSVSIEWKPLIQEEIICKQAVLKVEQTCENMLRHGHCLSAEGILRHLRIVEQQFNHIVMAILSSLKDTLLSVSCSADSLNEELHAVGKNLSKAMEHEFPADKFFKEISQLLQQGHVEDAFTMALSLRNSSVTSWICKQVDLRTLFAMSAPPLSQGVILLLVKELAVDVGHESSDKLAWMEQTCLALVPNHHPDLCMHPSLEQVYTLLQGQLHLFTTNPKLANQARLVMHLVNSLMAFCL